jgi:hypothetical protein
MPTKPDLLQGTLDLPILKTRLDAGVASRQRLTGAVGLMVHLSEGGAR